MTYEIFSNGEWLASRNAESDANYYRKLGYEVITTEAAIIKYGAEYYNMGR